MKKLFYLFLLVCFFAAVSCGSVESQEEKNVCCHKEAMHEHCEHAQKKPDCKYKAKHEECPYLEKHPDCPYNKAEEKEEK